MWRQYQHLGCKCLSLALLGIGGTLAFPLAYEPDLITPVVVDAFDQAQFVHLTIGNLILGIVEASLLVAAFGTPRPKTAFLMVLANYASACGYFPASLLLGSPLSPEQLPVAFPIAFVMTVAIEAPFVVWCFPKGKRSTKRWVAALVAAQVLSYALLAVFYVLHPWIFSDFTTALLSPSLH